jgi:hypothetical protein
MTDRELLELAAKAAGYTPTHVTHDGIVLMRGARVKWRPLEDDGDALRLAVALQIKVKWHKPLNQSLAWIPLGEEIQVNGERFSGDKFATTRRAIVLAAAEIGRAMP